MRIRKTVGKGARSAVAAAVIAALPVVALADPGATREQQLEQRVAELEAQLENVVTAMQTTATSQTSLESRIAELQASAAADDGTLKAYWSKGIRMDSADKSVKLKFGGRIMNDWGTFDADKDVETAFGADEFQTGTEFRRARFYMAGTIYNNVGFKAQYDFEGGDAGFKDVYISLKTGLGKVTAGHHYVPFGLEEQTSSKYMTFMERSFAAQLSPSRKTGISVHNTLADQWDLRVGMYRPGSNGYGDDKGNLGAGEWGVSGRIAGAAWKDDESKSLLHVGLSAAMQNESEGTNSVGLPDELTRVRARGAQHLSTRFADTGTFVVDGSTMLLGLEAAYVAGPFHIQGEYVSRNYDTPAGDFDATAYGIEAGYFLTGESRKYKGGNFDRVSPGQNYGDEDGAGAWQVALRYDTIDLNDGPLLGGEVDQVTLGLNWHLNPNTRVMWNYAQIDIKDVGNVDYFGMRFQVDF